MTNDSDVDLITISKMDPYGYMVEAPTRSAFVELVRINGQYFGVIEFAEMECHDLVIEDDVANVIFDPITEPEPEVEQS